jgi:hypothetical protein
LLLPSSKRIVFLYSVSCSRRECLCVLTVMVICLLYSRTTFRTLLNETIIVFSTLRRDVLFARTGEAVLRLEQQTTANETQGRPDDDRRKQIGLIILYCLAGQLFWTCRRRPIASPSNYNQGAVALVASHSNMLTSTRLYFQDCTSNSVPLASSYRASPPPLPHQPANIN